MARIAAGALAAAAIAVVAASVALAAQSPKQLQNAILAAARAQHSVHWVRTDHAKTSGRMVCDVANDRGIQRISITKGGRTGHVIVLVVHRTAYIRGDAFAMHAYMGFSTTQASRYHGRWISIPHSFPSYGTVAAAVTLPSFVHHLGFNGSSLSAVTGTFGGRKVTGVRRHARFEGLPTVETMYARAHGTPLPVAVVQVAASKGYRDTLTMSHWNEAVHVSAPAHPVPITTVVGG